MTMAIFVDTSIFVATRNKRDQHHKRAVELMEQALQGKYGRILTSDYVVDEAITTALARTHDHQIAVNTGTYILDSKRIERLAVSEDVFKRAWRKFQTLKEQYVSFTDCTSLAIMEVHGVRRIMSFDHEFDGFVNRIA